MSLQRLVEVICIAFVSYFCRICILFVLHLYFIWVVFVFYMCCIGIVFVLYLYWRNCVASEVEVEITELVYLTIFIRLPSPCLVSTQLCTNTRKYTQIHINTQIHKDTNTHYQFAVIQTCFSPLLLAESHCYTVL